MGVHDKRAMLDYRLTDRFSLQQQTNGLNIPSPVELQWAGFMAAGDLVCYVAFAVRSTAQGTCKLGTCSISMLDGAVLEALKSSTSCSAATSTL